VAANIATGVVAGTVTITATDKATAVTGSTMLTVTAAPPTPTP
jgi:hypothetical protein